MMGIFGSDDGTLIIATVIADNADVFARSNA
jgi:hypothetical protein